MTAPSPTRCRLALLLPACVALCLGACGAMPQVADPRSDAPEARSAAPAMPFKDAVSYAQALQTWQSAEDINAWIGQRFEYDKPRAMRLSETQRSKSGPLPIFEPQAFFTVPSGVCVDLSRFAVESLRQIDPTARPRYLMIEFAPVTLNGNTLRMHWVASFDRDGQLYVFADSKRPGFIAGPYANAQAFIEDYARYRGRQIVGYRELDSYQRKQRVLSVKTARVEVR